MSPRELSEWIVKVGVASVVRQLGPKTANPGRFAEVAEALAGVGTGFIPSAIMLAMCVLHPKVPELRRLTTITIEAARFASDPQRLGALAAEVAGMAGWTVN